MTPEEFFVDGPGQALFEGLRPCMRSILYKILSDPGGRLIRLSGPPASGKSHLLTCCAAYTLNMLINTPTTPVVPTVILNMSQRRQFRDLMGDLVPPKHIIQDNDAQQLYLSNAEGAHRVHVVRETSHMMYRGLDVHSAFLDWWPHAAGQREHLRANFVSRGLGGWFIVVDDDVYETITLPGRFQ